MDSSVWGEIESESDTEFSEDYGMMEEVPTNSEDSTINPIDISSLMRLLDSWFGKLIDMQNNT